MPKTTQRHLTPEEQEQILQLHAKGMQQKQIAKLLSRTTSSIHYFIRISKQEKAVLAQSNDFASLPNNVLFHHTRDYTF